MSSLEDRMETNEVKLRPGTNLFLTKGINAVACGGTHNIPDGEVLFR